MRLLLLSLLLAIASPLLARPMDIGQSGAPGTEFTCAYTCHGPSGGTVTVTGFPEIYEPDQAYLITVRTLSGFSIKNFNASVRLGNRRTIAGTLSAGLYTETYSTQSESIGVHLNELDQDSATFTWTAPGPLGPVQLFLAAHQGPRWEGPNTQIMLWSYMSYPDSARNPRPNNGSQNVLTTANLYWTPGLGTLTHDVYFGTESDPPFSANVADSSYDPPGDMLGGTWYYWRIDERNNAGVMPGQVWSFFTQIMAADDYTSLLPDELALGPAYPNPFNATVTIPFALPRAAEIAVSVYDLTGREVARLAQGIMPAGIHRVQWSSHDVASGVYLVRMDVGSEFRMMKVVALK